jgi:hypothetical protein
LSAARAIDIQGSLPADAWMHRPVIFLEHDPEKCEAVFPRDKRQRRLRGDHAQSKNQSAMTIQPNLIAL